MEAAEYAQRAEDAVEGPEELATYEAVRMERFDARLFVRSPARHAPPWGGLLGDGFRRFP